MKDSEDEIVKRPKRDPKERQSKTKDLLRKQNPLITGKSFEMFCTAAVISFSLVAVRIDLYHGVGILILLHSNSL